MVAEGFPRRTKAGFGPHLRKLGYGRGWGRPWTSDEDALLMRVYADGTSRTPLIARLGRTTHSIKWRAEYLGLRGTHANRDGFRSGQALRRTGGGEFALIGGETRTGEQCDFEIGRNALRARRGAAAQEKAAEVATHMSKMLRRWDALGLPKQIGPEDDLSLSR